MARNELRIGVFEAHSHFLSIANPPRPQILPKISKNQHFSKNRKIRKSGNPPGSAAMGGAPLNFLWCFGAREGSHLLRRAVMGRPQCNRGIPGIPGKCQTNVKMLIWESPRKMSNTIKIKCQMGSRRRRFWKLRKISKIIEKYYKSWMNMYENVLHTV